MVLVQSTFAILCLHGGFFFFFFSLHNILTLLHVHIYVYDLRSTEQAMKGTAIQALGNRTFRKKKERTGFRT